MKKTLSTKDGTLDWYDAQEGDRVRVNDKTMRVARYEGELMVSAGIGLGVQRLYYWQEIGAHLEREVEEHPHGLIPSEYRAVILITGVNGEQYVYHRHNGDWYIAGVEDEAADYVQALADEYGFEVLWPRPKVEVTDEMVEELAPRLRDDFYQFWVTTWDETTEGSKRNWRSVASVALEYALGGDK